MAGNAVYYCPRCGAQLAPGAQFCAACGQAIAQPAPPPAPVQAAPAPMQTAPLPAQAPPPGQMLAPGYAYAQPAPARSPNTGVIVLLVVFLGLLVAGGAVGIGYFMLKSRTAPPAGTTATSTGVPAYTGETPSASGGDTAPPPHTGETPVPPGGVTPGGGLLPPHTGETPAPPVSPPSHPARVAVPNVVGLSKADALRSLEATGGFQPTFNDSRYSDRYGAGTIIAQSPSPGTVMESGDAVYLVESLGISAPAPPPPPRRRGGGYYILSGSDSHYLHGGEVQGLSNWELTLARNEIYARHGRPFDNGNIRAYFLSQGWYAPDYSFSEGRLSKVERTNAEFIRDWQTDRYGKAATGP